ncbi:MAG: sigma-54-dependent Fis family transcriptional regulator [Candidatus Dadabacteria bacterium]|nr:MAG: sigma-54-dependent Fis family transcriptional regulator [Candidatus Dadabacteria bacterium]
MDRILIVEDDFAMLETCAQVLARAGFEVRTAGSGREALEVLQASAFDVVLTDLRMPEVSGLDVLRAAKHSDPETVVILITAFPTVDTAVEALKQGAADYLLKPFSTEQLRDAVRQALDKRRAKEEYGFLRSQARRAFTPGGLIGRSEAMLRLFDELRKAAAVDAGVLLVGESGTGKELAARCIHESSARAGRPFVALNCAAIPETLLEGEMFGHEAGAFTDARKSRAGLLEQANGGTLLLDELCEMTPPLQAKLLRALEEGKVRRVGGSDPIEFDVRFIASTNRDVRRELREQRLRADLYYRIAVIEIHVPPLRERKEDVPLLAAHFLEEYSRAYGRTFEGFTRAATDCLTRYDWPGNVRELRNTIERAVTYGKGPLVEVEDLPAAVQAAGQEEDEVDFHRWKERTLERLEKEFLTRALRENDGNVTHTARALGIHRSTLQRMMRKHGISGGS